MSKKQPRQNGGRSRSRLPRRVRWTLASVTALPLLSLGVASGVYFVSVYHLLRAHLVPIAEAELTRQFGHEVRIGGADFSHSGRLVVTNIAVSNKATFAKGGGEAALTAQRVSVGYNLHDLIFDSGNAAHAIGAVGIDQPVVLIERYPGRFNFTDFFKPSTKKPGKPFVGRVVVKNGTLRFRDFDAPARGLRPALNTLGHIGATVDFGSERTIYFTLGGAGAAQTAARLVSLGVDGTVSRKISGRFSARVDARNADAAYWSDYFKAFPQARIVRGRVDADVVVAKLGKAPPPGLPLDLSGNVAVRDVTVVASDKKILALPLQHLSGTAGFTGAGASLDARVSVAGQPLALTGTLFDFASPQVAAALTSPSLNPVRLARALPALTAPVGLAIAPGPVRVSFTGTVKNPTITVNLAFPSVTYGGSTVTNVMARATYANKVLSVPAATLTVGGGQVQAHGTVNTAGKTPAVLLAGQVSGLNLSALRLPASPALKSLNLGGRVNAQFVAGNGGGPVTLTANVEAQNLRLRQTQFQSLTGRVHWKQGGAVTVAKLLVRGTQGTLTAAGTIPVTPRGGGWNLTVRAAGLDVPALLRPYSKLALGGSASFDGKIVGPQSAPSAVGAVRLAAPRFGRYAADFISGTVTASASDVRLDNVTLRRFPAVVGVSGTVRQLSGGNPALDLNVRLSQGDVRDFLQLATSASAASPKTAKKLTASLPNLTGTADGAFQVTGRAQSPVVTGHARVLDATVAGYRVDQVGADILYANGAVRVENGVLQSEGATLRASGVYSAKGQILGQFDGQAINLSRFHEFVDPYAEISGTAALAGRVAGTVQSPRVVLSSLTIPNLVVDRQEFALLSLAAVYDDGVLTQTGDPWRFVVQIPPEVAGGKNGLVEYDVNALTLALPTPAHPKRPAALELSAAIPEAAPEHLSHVFSTIRRSPWSRSDAGKQFLTKLAALPQPVAGTFALPRLSVSGPLAAPRVRADLVASGLLLGETRLAGLTVSVALNGGPRPSGSVTAKADSLLAGGVPIGELTADASFDNRVITVRSLRARSDRAFLNASGTADLDGPVNASVDASNIPIALIRTAVPKASPFLRLLPREVSTLSVQATGPTQSPNLLGSVSLSNPDIPLGKPLPANAPAYALDRIRTGTVTLASETPGGPKVLTVSNLSAFKDGRLVATLSGSLPVVLPGLLTSAALPNQDLRANLNVQDLSALAGFSPGLLDAKKTKGSLNVSASFGGGELSGLVTLKDASVGLTQFDTALSKLNGIIVLGNNRATVQSFTGQSSKGGTLALSGTATLLGDQKMDLKLTASDLKIDENTKQNVLYQKFSSGLKAKLNGSVTAIGPWLTPRVTTPDGSPLVVSDAVGTLPSASTDAATSGGAPSFNPTFDVAVQLGGDRLKPVTVRSSLLSADASGLVRLLGRLSAPKLQASLSVTKGSFFLPPSTRLVIVKPTNGIDRNKVSLLYPVADAQGVPTLQTRVDLTAQATVTTSEASLAQYRSSGNTGGIGEAAPEIATATRGGSTFGSGRQRYTITAHIKGVLNSPDSLDLNLTSSPPGLNRSQMLAALVPAGSLLTAAGTGGGERALEDQFKTALASVALPTLLSPITDSIAGALGLEDFGVSYDPNLPLFVTVTKQLLPRLEVTFSRSFGARGPVETSLQPPQYNLKLSYSFTNRYRVGVSTTDQHDNAVTLEGVVRF